MSKTIIKEPAFLYDLHKIREKMFRKAGYDVHKFVEMIRNNSFIEKKEPKKAEKK